MNLPFFLYRRLSRFITCEFKLFKNNKTSIKSKYEISSFQDVFCNPFYWQIYSWQKNLPQLVVDCGANCGHFSVLTENIIKIRYPESQTQYVLIEPNPNLKDLIKKNLKDSNFEDRCIVKQALIGKNTGKGKLYINKKNYLISSLKNIEEKQNYYFEVDYLNLNDILPDNKIDILKIDVEGAELDFIQNNEDILERTNLIIIEIHEIEDLKKILTNLKNLNFRVLSKITTENNYFLLSLEKNYQ